MFENKKILVLGMARSGYEVAKVLARHQNQILVTDANEQDPDHVNELENLGVTCMITKDPLELLDESYDYVIKNPGISYHHPLVLKANELNIPVTNEVEVAYSLLPEDVKIISITGSNGKTTTTTLIYEFLKEAGFPVHLGGNIGFPLCSILSDIKKGDILVLEISGHQQHDFIHYHSDIVVMTNLSEVHLDFFGTYENYKKNKSRILHNQTKNDVAILNLDNDDVLEVSKDILSKKLYFSSHVKADADLEEDGIYYKGEPFMKCDEIRMKGVHNYENIMAALLATKELGIDDDSVKHVLSRFKGVEHRIEFVREFSGRTFYNDSKSTNVKSTQIALNTFHNPTILLLGGLDRGHSFDELEPYMTNVKAIVCYGETKERIYEFAKRIGKDCFVCQNLIEATHKAYEQSDRGDTILLSPACASWDQYKSFEDRGNEYKKVVNEL